MDLKRDCGSRWHAIDWDAALAGSVVADHLFLRSGVIRKDLLNWLVPRLYKGKIATLPHA